MGVVLLARQRSLGREVAVKRLRAAAGGDDGARALVREASLMASVEHPNVVPVHALGRDLDGRPVLVMKRVEGTSWRALLDDDAHPAWAPLLAAWGDRAAAHLEVLQRVADAAHYAHARGVVHRDIKPENVMVGAFGEVYLVDWGVALRAGDDAGDGVGVRGTPGYMAPEMVEGDPARVDARTDVYLLGATLHAVLTGAPRHVGESLWAVLFSAHRSAPYAYGPAVPEELAALCNDATHVDPARRPRSAQEFRRRVADHLGHRASLTLTDAAQARLEALAACLAGQPVDDVLARRLGAEARFGFVHALAVWADNLRAREGLRRVLEHLFELEVSRENLDAARALAAEHGAPDAAMERSIAALSERLHARREREAAALREAHESDLSQGRRARLPLFLFLIAITTSLNVAARRVGSGATLESLAAVNLVVFVAVAAVLVGVRRQLLVNRVNRQFGAVVLLCVFATALHRAASLAMRPRPSVASVVVGDELLLGFIAVTTAVALRGWFAWIAALCFLAAGFALAQPAHALTGFGVANTAMLVVGLYFGWVRAAPRA